MSRKFFKKIIEKTKIPYPMVWLDESLKQLISERRASFTIVQGVEHVNDEYTREETVDLYMVMELLTGRREVLVKAQHTRPSLNLL